MKLKDRDHFDRPLGLGDEVSQFMATIVPHERRNRTMEGTCLHGHIGPLGIGGRVTRIEAILAETEIELSQIVREERHDLLSEIGEKTARIDEKTNKPCRGCEG